MRATIKGIVINCAEDAYNLVHKRLSRKEQEDFLCLVLDTKHNVVGPAVHVARGTLSSVQVVARDVFREAVRRNGAAIVMVHNHPSGDVELSPDDRQLTAKLVAGGKLLGIDVLDHIVVGSDSYMSFAERGLI